MTPALDASADFLRLRDPVWTRFHARHPVYPRERFEDAYSEWWTREVERGVAGRPSRPVMPVAFVADAVHRVLIDEGRALARGLSRGAEKHALAFVGLDEVEHGLAGDEDDGAYRVLVHRILDLVHARLTARELSVFVASYLYLQPVSIAAQALGLSVPRVKKDRARIARKVGEEVWAVLQAELDLCEAYSERRLPAVLELLTVHVDGCPRCRAQLGPVRRSAHAVVGPVEVLALGGATGGLSGMVDEVWSRVSNVADAVVSRLSGVSDAVSANATVAGTRVAEVAASVPPAGRTAAIVGLVAAAVAGGGAVVERQVPERETRAARQTATAAPQRITPPPAEAPVVPTPTVAPPAARDTAGSSARRPAAAQRRAEARRRRAAERRRRAAAAARRRAASRRAVPTPAPTVSPAAPVPPDGGTEFGFESG